ncbi:BglG family transcription antiterminator [Alicyclobacillus cycloheptanicus]|uniref:Mannitol operon transcriptional antiterminator n=1 Tax=Alicyclobacillus cycloheptanicus TaxID=1457 RepID=A0ABT9XGR8_9BACL|nr:PRD domain-containing protein [Alicyclobacillus cycloheptanicus]MDQ0189492.1 mannitol operon transcriptional antiterminator [Alicyclobacillus cycloheptanicus]
MDTLVRRLQVSRRTIQRDLHAMQMYLRTFQLVLRVEPQNIELRGESARVTELLEHVGKLPETLALRPKDRELQVALDLLIEEGPSKLGYFGRQLNVTAASLSQSMDDLAQWLRAHGLELIRRRGYGVEVRGDEAARREAIADLVHDQVSLPDLVAFLRQVEEQGPLHPMLAWFAKWFRADVLAKVRSVLLDELADSNPPLDEAAFYGFMLHVLLTMTRVTQGAILSAAGQPDAAPLDVQVCTRILQRLLPQAANLAGEAHYLANHLRGAKVLMTEENRILPLHITSMDLAYRIIQRLETALAMPLTRDQHFITGMAQHLEPAIHRLTAGLLIRNPLLPDIRRQYPALFEAMRDATDYVLARYHLEVPDEEIGYLTMHLGASVERQRAQSKWRARIVCLNGISSAELLASRIQKEFPQIQIVGVSALDAPQEDACDLVISTVPYEDSRHPVVMVSPFLTPEERRNVQVALDDLESTRPSVGFSRFFSETEPKPDTDHTERDLSERVFVQTTAAENLREVIDQIADDVWSGGYATDRASVIQAILQREHLGRIVLPGKRLSVLHARCGTLRGCFIGVYRLQSPIVVPGVGKTEEAVDTVLVLLARMDESMATIRLLGKVSSALVMDPDMVAVLRAAPVAQVRQSVLRAMVQTEE